MHIENDALFLALVVLGSLLGGAAGAALAFWLFPVGC